MGAQSQQADEYSPLYEIDFDPDQGAIVGKHASQVEAPMDGESAGVLQGHYVGKVRDVLTSFRIASAAPEFFIEHMAPLKYADELEGLLGSQLKPDPVPGAEDYIAVLNEQATNPYSTKEPKTRPGDQPPAGQIQGNLASSPGDLLPSSEAAMMSLLFDF